MTDTENQDKKKDSMSIIFMVGISILIVTILGVIIWAGFAATHKSKEGTSNVKLSSKSPESEKGTKSSETESNKLTEGSSRSRLMSHPKFKENSLINNESAFNLINRKEV